MPVPLVPLRIVIIASMTLCFTGCGTAVALEAGATAGAAHAAGLLEGEADAGTATLALPHAATSRTATIPEPTALRSPAARRDVAPPKLQIIPHS